MRKIMITPAQNGIIVRVGCQVFVTEDIKKGMDDLTSLLMNRSGECEERLREKWDPTYSKDYGCMADQPAPPNATIGRMEDEF